MLPSKEVVLGIALLVMALSWLNVFRVARKIELETMLEKAEKARKDAERVYRN